MILILALNHLKQKLVIESIDIPSILSGILKDKRRKIKKINLYFSIIQLIEYL